MSSRTEGESFKLWGHFLRLIQLPLLQQNLNTYDAIDSRIKAARDALTSIHSFG